MTELGPPLPRSFYERDTIRVARDLLGAVLIRGGCSGRIVETEAYLGIGDAAAHSARGITPRTRVIFGHPGHAYVYFIYGMYHCLNLVAEPKHTAGCVLVRAIEPLTGLERIRGRRNGIRRDEDLANGPGKLTLAFGINARDNGKDVTRGSLTVHAPDDDLKIKIGVSGRIGITKSEDLPLRFFIEGNRFVSGFKSAPRR